MIARIAVVAIALMVAIVLFVPGPRAVLDRARFPRRSFAVQRAGSEYSFDSRRGVLTKHFCGSPPAERTIRFQLPDSAIDRLYVDAISSRLFDAGQPRRLERAGSWFVGDQPQGFEIRSGSKKRDYLWTSNDWTMRDLKDDRWRRLDHFRAMVDSVVHAEASYQALPPSQPYAL